MPCKKCHWDELEQIDSEMGEDWRAFRCPDCGNLQAREYPSE